MGLSKFFTPPTFVQKVARKYKLKLIDAEEVVDTYIAELREINEHFISIANNVVPEKPDLNSIILSDVVKKFKQREAKLMSECRARR